MIVKPIIPIWLMVLICVFWLALKRRNAFGYLRQVAMVALIFLVNLRISIPDSNVKKQTKELDLYVLFVVDDTISMLADDYNGNTTRLDAAKEECCKIIDKFYGAKFSTISFNNKAMLLTPFTRDTNLSKNAINAMYPIEEFYSRGSSMNVCKDIFLSSLKKAKDKGDGKVAAFFISDGEITNDEELESFADMADYIDYGAVIGYGTEAGGTMLYKSFWDEEEHVIPYYYSSNITGTVKSKIDEETLIQIAKDLDVEYIHMQQAGDLDSLLEQILKDSIETSNMEDGLGNKDISFVFLIPLTMILIFELFTNKKENIQF